MKPKIAVVVPEGRIDYLSRTILDGLIVLSSKGEWEFRSSATKWNNWHVTFPHISEQEFVQYGQEADLVILSSAKSQPDLKLVEAINKWHETMFVDGSEVGGNLRYTQTGAINEELKRKCVAYFRREKPYPEGVMPLPFGIETSFIAYKPGIKKDIDFVCIFGQEQFPPMRKEVREEVERFCQKNNFSYKTKQTKFLFWDIYSAHAQKKFYKTLARSKVAVSVGGGGFDTARFWEILANNCLLLTEMIDIYPTSLKLRGARPDIPPELDYSRITQFKDLPEFKIQLKKMGEYLRTNYPPVNLESEYQAILAKHSSRARVETILAVARAKGILKA